MHVRTQMLACGFLVHVRVEFVRRHGGLDTVGWHLDLRAPKDRVQHNLSEVVVAPVLVEVSARETKTAPAIRTLDGPHDVLGFAHVFLNLWITAVRIVDAWLAARAVWRKSS